MSIMPSTAKNEFVQDAMPGFRVGANRGISGKYRVPSWQNLPASTGL